MTTLWMPPEWTAPPVGDRERAHEHTVAWASQVGLTASDQQHAWYAAWNVEELAARAFNTSDSTLELATDWMGWMSIIDDWLESALPRQIAPVLDAISEAFTSQDSHRQRTRTRRDDIPTYEKPMVESTVDLWERTIVHMPAFWQHRTACEWRIMSDSLLWENQIVHTDTVPDLSSYLRHRNPSGALPLVWCLLEPLHGYTLTDELYYNGILVSLRQLAADQICWANDIVCHDRENAYDSPINLVSVLAHAHQVDHNAAMTAAIQMTNNQTAAFLAVATAARHHLPTTAISQAAQRHVLRLIDDLMRWMAGSLDYHRDLSTRHRDHESGIPNPFRADQAMPTAVETS